MTSRYPLAVWKDGVTNFGYPRGTHGQLRANAPWRAFCHDAAGWRGGALATFRDPARGAAHAIINLDGPPWQFVDFDDAAWHAGGNLPGLGEFANLFCWGIEFEGGFPTPSPITDYQIEQALLLFEWLATRYAFTWKAERRLDLWEHREVYATACPSGRIRWPEIIHGLRALPVPVNDLADLADLRAQLVQTQLVLTMHQKNTAAQLENVNRKWGAFYAATCLTKAALLDDRRAFGEAIDAAIDQLRRWPRKP
jgi:hypothetical protein